MQICQNFIIAFAIMFFTGLPCTDNITVRRFCLECVFYLHNFMIWQRKEKVLGILTIRNSVNHSLKYQPFGNPVHQLIITTANQRFSNLKLYQNYLISTQPAPGGWGGGVQKSSIGNPRHPNVFCCMCASQLVIFTSSISNQSVTLNRLFLRNTTILTSVYGVQYSLSFLYCSPVSKINL